MRILTGCELGDKFLDGDGRDETKDYKEMAEQPRNNGDAPGVAQQTQATVFMLDLSMKAFRKALPGIPDGEPQDTFPFRDTWEAMVSLAVDKVLMSLYW